MYDNPHSDSPLAQFLAAELGGETPAEAGVQLSERAFMGHINLRGEPSDQTFLEIAEDVLGVGLPLEPNTVSEGHDVTLLWLGPNEWLILTSPGGQHEIIPSLRNALGNLFSAVTDVSGGQTIINIQGPHARDVLSKGCTLDLHPRFFGPGQCAQTNIDKATATIRQLDESPSYHIIVRRSFADHLASWLKDGAQEYGVVLIDQSAE